MSAKDNELTVLPTVQSEEAVSDLELPEGVTLEPALRDAMVIMAEITSAKAAHCPG